MGVIMSSGAAGNGASTGSQSAFMSTGAAPQFKKEKLEEKKIELTAEVITTELNLEELQNKYFEKFGKKLVGRYAKDANWIQEKLNS